MQGGGDWVRVYTDYMCAHLVSINNIQSRMSELDSIIVKEEIRKKLTNSESVHAYSCAIEMRKFLPSENFVECLSQSDGRCLVTYKEKLNFFEIFRLDLQYRGVRKAKK